MTTELSADEVEFLLDVVDLARTGDTAALAEMLDAGVPVNLANAAGDTLLILAAYTVHPATVSMLLDRGAQTGRVNNRGQTALGAAVFRQSAPVVATLLAAGADPGAGSPSAVEIADFFDLPAMTAMLTLARPPHDGQEHDEPGSTTGQTTAREVLGGPL